MTTQVLGPVVGLLFMICGLSATMSSGDSDAISGVTILLIPAFKDWVNATMGGPAVPATIVSLVFGVVVSLIFPADNTPEEVRLQNVMNDRRGGK